MGRNGVGAQLYRVQQDASIGVSLYARLFRSLREQLRLPCPGCVLGKTRWTRCG